MNDKKILVVEDEHIIAMEICDRLEKMGYRVSGSVDTKEKAIRSVETDKPDMVLMDIMLSGEPDGLEAADYISKKHNIPVIFLTAYSDKNTLSLAKLTQPYGYILKPLDEREIRSTLEIALYKSEIAHQLKEKEEWFSTTLNCIGEAVITIDTKGIVISVNPVAETLSGHSGKQIIGQPISSAFRFARDEESGTLVDPLQRSMETGEITSNPETIFLIPRSGRKIPVETNAAPILNDRREIIGGVLAFRDISKKLQLEGQLRQTGKMESIGALAGGIAHDFNNILTTIRGVTDMALLDIGHDSPLHESLEEIRESTEQATDLTRQLLLFSRKQPLRFAALNLNAVIENTTRMLYRLIGDQIVIKTDLHKDIWPIQADESTMKQILLNLAINARDAMSSRGNLTIRTANTVIGESDCEQNLEAYPGEFACLSVADDGKGMDRETVRQIFEPFFTTKKRTDGTGLGLSVVYGIVQGHKGWIHVDSTPGKGTRFDIYFPAVHEKAPEKTWHKPSFDSLKGNGESILVVEDAGKIREHLERIFGKAGYSASLAATSKEAEAIFRSKKGDFDLLFTDVVLPDESGVKLAERLLKNNPKLRVLLCSGYPEYSSKWSDIQSKKFHFLQKPYDIFSLLQSIRNILTEPQH